MDLIKLGEILKSKRKNELKLSLREAAELIGISHNYLSILEKAKDPRSNAPIRPTIDTLKLITDAYKMDINTLLPLAGYGDIVIKKNDEEEMTTIAAHFDGDEFTEEELQSIEEFKEFVKNRRKKKDKK